VISFADFTNHFQPLFKLCHGNYWSKRSKLLSLTHSLQSFRLLYCRNSVANYDIFMNIDFFLKNLEYVLPRIYWNQQMQGSYNIPYKSTCQGFKWCHHIRHLCSPKPHSYLTRTAWGLEYVKSSVARKYTILSNLPIMNFLSFRSNIWCLLTVSSDFLVTLTIRGWKQLSSTNICLQLPCDFYSQAVLPGNITFFKCVCDKFSWFHQSFSTGIFKLSHGNYWSKRSKLLSFTHSL